MIGSVPRSHSAMRVALAFLDRRLSERSTVEWALRLEEADIDKRAAIEAALRGPSGQVIADPWLTAWRLIEESWRDHGARSQRASDVFEAARWLAAGDRSGELVSAIVDLVRPRLKVEPLSKLDVTYGRVRTRPQAIRDLLKASLESGDVVDPTDLHLDSVLEISFLVELANELSSAVNRGLAIAARIEGETSFWRLGGLNRVWYVPLHERRETEHEPDEFSHGIAPSVKLLLAVVTRIGNLSRDVALGYARQWQIQGSAVHTRLWAGLAGNTRLLSGEDVGRFLLVADDEVFWNLSLYPEVAALRAVRFADLSSADRTAVLRRIEKGPPRSNWPSRAENSMVIREQEFVRLRELRRIEVASGLRLETAASELLESPPQFDQLRGMTRVDEGFPGTQKATWVAPNPDDRFAYLEGEERLIELDKALATRRSVWDDDPARRAADWMSLPGNCKKVLGDLQEAAKRGARHFPNVWERFGWIDSADNPENQDQAESGRSRHVESVLELIDPLPSSTMRAAIEGISYWMNSWAKHFVSADLAHRVWLKLWPIAVEATNAQQLEDQQPSLSVVVKSSAHEDLDTLNTAAGRLVGAFLSMCPSVTPGTAPFERSSLKKMRDVAVAASGRSGLIARYRMIESLKWFLIADEAWAKAELIAPLEGDGVEAQALWRAVARRALSRSEIEILGDAIATRSVDLSLGRQTRESLIFSLVIDSLHSLWDGRSPSISSVVLTQALRGVEDEVRATAAAVVKRFVGEMAGTKGNGTVEATPEALARTAAVPFIEKVWPRDLSLTTPGVARALAQLPSASGAAFVDVVNAVERLLVPFNSWSMVDYGLWSSGGPEKLASVVDNPSKAEALLRLLHATINRTEGGTVPMDLGDVLDHVRNVAPKLSDSQAFRDLRSLVLV